MIARGVTVPIVDRFQIIDVGDQQREPVPGTSMIWKAVNDRHGHAEMAIKGPLGAGFRSRTDDGLLPAGEDHQKFVAPDAAADVVGAQAVAQKASHPAERLIARGVTVPIVDRFQIIDVPGYRFSVLVADVDDLKGVNDRHGHAVGDQAIRWVAGFLSHGLRADDVCCRIGGDEFLVILPACGGDACRRFVKRVRARWQVAAQAREQAGGRLVAVSLGTASYPAHGATAGALWAAADGAMYEEKRRALLQPTPARQDAGDPRASTRVGGRAP